MYPPKKGNEMGKISRAGFYDYRKANPCLRYGQAFCNYFLYHNEKLFFCVDAEQAKQQCQKLMDDWQIPERG